MIRGRVAGLTVGRMPEFVAETCAPRDVPGAPMERAADIALAAGRASQRGGAVRFLGVILVPDEETCFWRYQAPSAGVVRLAMIRARLRPGRITLAVPVGPPDARPDPAPAAGRICPDKQVMTGRACS